MKKNQKSELVVVTINGTKILGTVTGNEVVGVVFSSSPLYDVFEHYLKNKELGRLQTTVVGDLGNLVTNPLNDADKIEFARLKSLLKLARKQVKAHTTCEIFDGLLGK